MEDGYKSVTRYLKNNFFDGARQVIFKHYSSMVHWQFALGRVRFGNGNMGSTKKSFCIPLFDNWCSSPNYAFCKFLPSRRNSCRPSCPRCLHLRRFRSSWSAQEWHYLVPLVRQIHVNFRLIIDSPLSSRIFSFLLLHAMVRTPQRGLSFHAPPWYRLCRMATIESTHRYYILFWSRLPFWSQR